MEPGEKLGGCCCIPGSSVPICTSQFGPLRCWGRVLTSCSLSVSPPHPQTFSCLHLPPSLFAGLSHREPQFLPWDPSLSSWLCSSAPPPGFGAPQSAQPCTETKPSPFTCWPHFPSSISQSFQFLPQSTPEPSARSQLSGLCRCSFQCIPLGPLWCHQEPVDPHRTRIKQGEAASSPAEKYFHF